MSDVSLSSGKKKSPSAGSSIPYSINPPASSNVLPESDRNTASMSPHSDSSTCAIGDTTVPEPGNIYMILDVGLERVLTLLDGKPRLLVDAGMRGGWQWECEQHPDGWIGFRNTVSGTYLGHDNKGGYIAKATKFDAWESFTLRPREVGGYNLCVKYGHKLKFMGISDKDGPAAELVDAPTPDEATRWKFVMV